MTRPVVSLSPEMTLEQAAERLAEKGISGAPVVDNDGRLLGVLSESDLLRHLNQIADADLRDLRLARPLHSLALLSILGREGHAKWAEVYSKLRKALVADAMTRDVHTAHPSDDLETVAALMIRENINRVPVLERDRVVGILSRADFTRFLAQGSRSIARL